MNMNPKKNIHTHNLKYVDIYIYNYISHSSSSIFGTWFCAQLSISRKVLNPQHHIRRVLWRMSSTPELGNQVPVVQSCDWLQWDCLVRVVCMSLKTIYNDMFEVWKYCNTLHM